MQRKIKYIPGTMDDRTFRLLQEEKPAIFVTLSHYWKQYIGKNASKCDSLVDLSQHTQVVLLDLLRRQRPLTHHQDVIDTIDSIMPDNDLHGRSLLIF